jgi:hypothetical protein
LWLEVRYCRISDVIHEVSHNRYCCNRVRLLVCVQSCEQNAGQYNKIKTGNKCFRCVESFKCFGTTYQIEIAFKKVKVKVPRNRPECPGGGFEV